MARQYPHLASIDSLDVGVVKSIETSEAMTVTSLCGDLWVTQLGDETDYILEGGSSLHLPGPSSVLVSPLGGPATLQLEMFAQTSAALASMALASAA